MKKIGLIMTLLLLTACSQAPVNEKSNESDKPVDIEPIEYVDYVETFDEFDFVEKVELTVADRHFLCEDNPENVAENLIYGFYAYNIQADWEKYNALFGEENEALQITAENEKKAFAEGRYIKEYIIHSLKTLTLDDIATVDAGFVDLYQRDAKHYGLKAYTVVQAEITMAHSQASLEAGPQIGDGTYTRYYLCGKTSDENAWRIFEIYWY